MVDMTKIGPFQELRSLREDYYDLEKINESLERDLKRADEALDEERQSMQELTATLRAEKSAVTTLQEINARLESDIRDLKSQLAAQRELFQARNFEEEQYKSHIRVCRRINTIQSYQGQWPW